jgi:hypothetical protein
VAGIDDDDAWTFRVARRVARRVTKASATDRPGILFLEIDGLSLPVLRRAIRDATTPIKARWLADGGHRLIEWETGLSSQTGASRAGILLGDNDDIPAFRWVDKATGTVVTCSSPDDCAAIEAARAGGGLLSGGGRPCTRLRELRRCRPPLGPGAAGHARGDAPAPARPPA